MPDNIELARKAKAARAQGRIAALLADVDEALASPRLPVELGHKLRYCRNEIQRGRDDGLVDMCRKYLQGMPRDRS